MATLYRDPYAALGALAAGQDPAQPVPAEPLLTPEELEAERRAAAEARRTESERAFRQGTQNVRASGYSTRGLLRILAGGDTESGVADLQRAQEIQAEAAQYGPRVQSVEDVSDIGSGLEYARNVGLTQVPNIAVTLGTGVVGGLSRVALRSAAGQAAERLAAKEIGEVAVRAAGRAAGKRAAFEKGAEVGAAAGGSVLQSSMAPAVVLDPEGKGTVEERAAAAALGSVATGALEALPVTALLRRYGLGAAEDAVKGSVLARVTQQAARQGAAEGATELAQTVGERATHRYVNDNVDLVGPEAYSDYINALAGGVVGGSLFGAPAGLRGAGRESAAGKSYRDALSGFTGRLKAAREKAAAGAAASAPAQPAPGEKVAEGDPIELNEIAQRASQFVKDISTQASEQLKDVGGKVKTVLDQFRKNEADLSEGDAVDHSLTDILDAEPYQFRTDESGLASLNDGKGLPFAQFADGERAKQYRGAGFDSGMAAVMATVPTARVEELTQSGAIGEAMKALRGEKDLNDDLLVQYEQALPPEARPMFYRAAATAAKMTDEDVRVPGREPGPADVAAEPEVLDATDEERQLRRAEDTTKVWRESTAGVVLPGGSNMKNALTVVDAKGTRRPLTGKVLGKLITDTKKDPEFSGGNREAVAQVFADLKLKGYDVDPGSLRAIELGKGWMLTEAQAKRIASDMQPAKPAKATVPTQRATRTGARDEAALNREFGRGDAVDTQRDEVEGLLGEPRGPVGARPAETRVGPEGQLTEAQPIDAGEVDADVLRSEREQFEAGDFNELDQLIERTTGEKVGRDFDARRRLYTAALAKAPKGGRVRQELQAAAGRFGEAMAESMRKRVNAARKKWQANKTSETFKAYNKARDNYEAAFASAAKATTTQAPTTRDPELTKQAKAAEREEAIDYDATSTPEGVAAEIPNRRSKRALYALHERVENSNFSGSTKFKLVERINEALVNLQGSSAKAAKAEASVSVRRTKTAQHYNSVFKALEGKDTLEAALTAAREFATPALARIIDTLTGMRAVRGVPFSVEIDEKYTNGRVSGRHVAPIASATSLNSRVQLERPTTEAIGLSVDPVLVLVHEAMHAATAYAERNNAESRRALEQLLDHARTYAKGLGVDPDSFYGLSETQEFVAEAFTNAQLQDLLRQIPARNTKKFQSLWDEFKDFVAKLLGFTSEDATALDEIFALSLDMARETAAAREAAFDALEGDPELIAGTDYAPTSIQHTPASGSQPTDYMALLGQNERRYMIGALRRGDVYRQIKNALPPNLHATLASADEGPTLLVNTGLALALQGKLDLTYDAKRFTSAVQGLWDVISRVLQLPSKTAYARAIIQDLRRGTSTSKVDAQALQLKPAALAVTRMVQQKIAPKVEAFTRDMDQRMRSSGVPALTQLATLISQRTGEFRNDQSSSYIARERAERGKRLNEFYSIVGGWDDKRKSAALEALQRGETTADATAVRGFFRSMRDYLKGAGLRFGDTENYFPVSVDAEVVAKRAGEFKALLGSDNFAKTLKDRGVTVDELYRSATSWNRQTHVGRATFADGDHDPTFRPLNKRLMDFIYKEGTPEQIKQFETFQDKNLDRVTVNYVNRAVRRAEWNRLNLGEQIKQHLRAAKAQGATPEQLQLAGDYIDQVMGSYGTDWHPWIARIADRLGVNLPPFDKFQSLQSALITYQNLRLLPLAALSSLIDPLGVSVRSAGDVGSAFNAYRDALRALRDKEGTDALRAMAQDMGVIERHAVSEALIYMFGGAGDPTGMSSRVNAALFKYNGLEAITKFSRLAALAAGHRFLIKHAGEGGNARYLQELGLEPDDVKVGENGYVERSAKIDAALTRFVDESVVRPQPAQRPGWHNDPHFALAAQYKGYLYSFWNTVTRRIGVELANNNPRVLIPIAMYLPVTAVGEMARDMAQGDDDDRDAAAYARLSIERSGLLGPHVNLLANARQDLQYGSSVLNSVAGPTGQQLGQAYDAVNGERGVGRTAVEALPGSALYEDWL